MHEPCESPTSVSQRSIIVDQLYSLSTKALPAHPMVCRILWSEAKLDMACANRAGSSGFTTMPHL